MTLNSWYAHPRAVARGSAVVEFRNVSSCCVIWLSEVNLVKSLLCDVDNIDRCGELALNDFLMINLIRSKPSVYIVHDTPSHECSAPINALCSKIRQKKSFLDCYFPRHLIVEISKNKFPTCFVYFSTGPRNQLPLFSQWHASRSVNRWFATVVVQRRRKMKVRKPAPAHPGEWVSS